MKADKIGLTYGYAGYNPEAVLFFGLECLLTQEELHNQVYEYTHPSDATRIANIARSKATAAKLRSYLNKVATITNAKAISILEMAFFNPYCS
jgi:predicted Zn-dependent protease